MGDATADPAELVKIAELLLQQGKLRESETLFQAVSRAPEYAAVGHYGIGFIRKRQGDFEVATKHLHEALRLNPKYANACYYLGELAEARGSDNAGRKFYEQTLQIDPNHEAARRKLGMAVYRATSNATDSSHTRPPQQTQETSSKRRTGVEILEKDQDPAAREALALIDKLDMTVVPRLSAYIGRMLRTPLVLTVLYVIITSIVTLPGPRLRGMADTLAILVFLLSGVAVIRTVLIAKTTRIQFSSGRVIVTSGLLARSVTNTELYRVVDVSLRRGFINLLTGDGTIELGLEEGRGVHEKLQLTGIASGAELDRIFEILRNLVLALRTSRIGKGVIY